MSNVESLLTSFQNSNINVDELMSSIINDYVLKVNNDTYNFCEIELYYYKKEKHEDCGVLKREKDVGDIFFHRYGMDICFNSNGTDEYGGILIRSLKQSNQYICGAWESSYKLLNSYHGKLCISIENKDEDIQDVCKTTRIRNSCKDDKFYRYITVEACEYIRQSDIAYWTKIKEKTQDCCKDDK